MVTPSASPEPSAVSPPPLKPPEPYIAESLFPEPPVPPEPPPHAPPEPPLPPVPLKPPPPPSAAPLLRSSQFCLRPLSQLHLRPPLLRSLLKSSPPTAQDPVFTPTNDANLPLFSPFGKLLGLSSMDIQVIGLDFGRALLSQILAWAPLQAGPVRWSLPSPFLWRMCLLSNPLDPPDPPDQRSPSSSFPVYLGMWFESFRSCSRVVTSYPLVMGCRPLPPCLSINYTSIFWLMNSYLTGLVLNTTWFTLELFDSNLGFNPHGFRVQSFRIPLYEVLWLFHSPPLPLNEDLLCALQARLKLASVQKVSRLIFTPLWFHVELIYDISVYPGAWVSLDFGCPFFSFMEIVCLLITPILCGIDVGSFLLTSSETSVSTLSTGSAIWCLNASFAATVLAIVNRALDAVLIADFRTLQVITNFQGCFLSSTAFGVKFRGLLYTFSRLRDLFASIYLLLSCYLVIVLVNLSGHVGRLLYCVNN